MYFSGTSDRSAGAAQGARDAASVTPSARASARAADSRAKRAFDLLISAAVLLFIAPLLLLVAGAIWLESGGPVLFRQARTGLNGRVFQVYKFRSMTVAEDGDAFRQATRGDARITGIGHLIRRTSIDELPQLLNVLRGEMSLVGPRPHPVALDARFQPTIAGYADRFQVKPGITGWAQVCGHRGETRQVEDMALRISHDLQYVQGWSFGLDLQILAKTLVVVPFDRAAF